MSKVQLQGNVSGTGVFTIASPNSNTDRTLTLPDNTGTLLSNATNLAGLTGVGKVLQVVQGTGQNSTVNTTSTTPISTAVSVDITPTSTTSRILVIGFIHVFKSSGTHVNADIYRNNSLQLMGGSAVGGSYVNQQQHYDMSGMVLDSPATTSSVNYRWYIWTRDAGGGTSVNLNDGGSYRSNIIALEIAA
jgi:hypothetical protein